MITSDDKFDQVYPEPIRKLSALHWTPVAIAARAATILTKAGSSRILDVGSGVGKFCIVGAMTTSAHFTGLERRLRLVQIAQSAATAVGVSRVAFAHASVEDFCFEGFDGIYLYNPFYEQISRFLPQIDEDVEHSAKLFKLFTEAVTTKLMTLASGTAVVTFNGFGGVMPRSYAFAGEEPAGDDHLMLWIKD